MEGIGITTQGYTIYAVRMSEEWDKGHWLSWEEMKLRKSDFPEDTVFVIGGKIGYEWTTA